MKPSCGRAAVSGVTEHWMAGLWWARYQWTCGCASYQRTTDTVPPRHCAAAAAEER